MLSLYHLLCFKTEYRETQANGAAAIMYAAAISSANVWSLLQQIARRTGQTV